MQQPSPQKSSVKSANEDLAEEAGVSAEREVRLRQINKFKHDTSPGYAVVAPEHPDKIFDYE